MAEQWLEHPGDSRYEVSSEGRVRNSETKRIRKDSISPSGYRTTVFSTPGGKHRAFYVHCSVMAAFVGPCPDGCEVSHLDGDNGNNTLSNLVYESRTKNMGRKKTHGTEIYGQRNAAHRLTDITVREIRALYAAGVKQITLANKYKVSPMTISRAVRGETWSHIK